MQLQKELHTLRTKNIALRDDSNKLRATNHRLVERIEQLQRDQTVAFEKSRKDFADFMALEQQLSSTKQRLVEKNKFVAKLEKSTLISRHLLYDTI